MKSERARKMLEIAAVYLEDIDTLAESPGLVPSSCAGGISSLLSVGVNEFDTVAGGVGFLLERKVSHYLSVLLRFPSEMVDAANGLSAYDFSVLIHVALLLNLDECATSLSELTVADTVSSTTFLREYNRALRALIAGHEYSWKVSPTRDLERYWKDYLLLIADLTNRRDFDQSLRAVASSLERRNKDGGIRDDGNVIEGSALEPVNWDFRAASLAMFVERRYGVDLRTATKEWSFRWE